MRSGTNSSTWKKYEPMTALPAMTSMRWWPVRAYAGSFSVNG